MKLKWIALGATLVFTLFFARLGRPASEANNFDLWYFHHSYITSDEAVAKSKALMDKAAAAGYNGVIFWDTTFTRMSGDPDWNWENQDRLREVMKYAHRKHLKTVAYGTPFGWSNDVLAVNHNWAEATRVIGAKFEVSGDGKTLLPKSDFPGLVNGNFEAGQTGWFGLGDRGVGVGGPAQQGSVAAVITNPPANGRLVQKVKVTPWRQYHLSFLFKTSNFANGSLMAQALDAKDQEKRRFLVDLHPNEQWTMLDYLFNSQDSTELNVYLGVWGGAKGQTFFDNVTLEESPLVYVTHREGTPFKLYDPANPGTVYAQGKDYNKVIDTDMLPGAPAFHNVFHQPPPFTLPSGTSLKAGQIVAADYYAAIPMTIENEMGMCLSEPAVYRWVAKNARDIKKIVTSDSDILLNYDEIRQANSCASCRAKNMTAGELLAWSFSKTREIYKEAMPSATAWLWSDMFDPYHNAHENFYYVEGNLAGSWKGVDRDVAILNWNFDARKNSLNWFSGANPDQPISHRQIIAGFYDRGDAVGGVRKDLQDASGIPGITGVMYTTWADDYSQLKAFADTARAAWPAYLKSVSKN